VESPLYQIAPSGLKIIETLRFDPAGGFTRLARHMDRAEATCARLRVSFDRAACLMALGEAVADTPLRCRLTVDLSGDIAVSTTPFPETTAAWRLVISDTRIDGGDPWRAVKTSQRHLFDRARETLPDGVEEVIFLNVAGQVCEGSISTVFVQKNGRLETPALECGLLPGVLRSELLDQGRAVESILTLRDLQTAEALFVGNSLRGLMPAVWAK
jgi:4-amino-4-deoxychorismate lyase